MDRNVRFVFSSLALAVTPALVAYAQADPSDLRVQAEALMKNGQHAQALPLLDQSLKLDSASSGAASSYFSRGRCYFTLKRYPEALKDFTEVTRRRPKVAPGWFNKGLTEIQMSPADWGGAVNSFTQVIQIDPKPRPGENLKLDALERRAQCYLETKIFDKAIADLNAVIATDNTRTTAWQDLAYAYTEVKPQQTDKAIEAYGKALGVAKPEDKHSLLLARADLYRVKQAWEPELNDLNAALKLKPSDAAVLNERASVYYRMNKFQEAVADYDAVAKLKTGADAIDPLRNKAIVLFGKVKNYAGAVEALTALLAKAPNDADALKMRGAAYLNMTPPNYAAAISDYQKYVAAKPTDAPAWKDLAVAAYNSAGSPPKDGPAITTALNAAEKAIALDPNKAEEPLMIKAEALSIKGNHKDAIDAYTKYLAKKPDDPNAFDGRGRAYFNTKQWAQAVSDFDKVLAKTPNDADVKRLRALALSKSPNGGTAALASLKEVAESNPNDPTAWGQYGVALFNAQKFDDAVKAFTKEADIRPKGTERTDALRNLCAAADKKAELSKSDADQRAAVAAYTKLLADAPNDTDAIGSRADLQLGLKMYKEAIADYTKLISVAPNGPEAIAAYNNRASCYLSLTPADYKSAIADYGQVIAKQPNDATAYNMRAIANLKMENYKAAIPDLDKYLSLKQGDPSALVNRGNAYFNLGNTLRTSATKGAPEFEKAAADYASYLNSKPGDAKVLYRRALCIYRQAGDSAKPETMNKAKLQAAIAAFETAAKASPAEAEANYYLGLACDNMGMAQDDVREAMFKKAIDAYKKYVATPGVKPEDATPVKQRITLLQDELG